MKVLSPMRKCGFTILLLLAFSSGSAQRMSEYPALPTKTSYPFSTVTGGGFPLLTQPVPQLGGDSVFTVLGRWAWGRCDAAEAMGNYVFIGNGPTFHVLDVSDPEFPVSVAEYLTDYVVWDIEIRDSLAYVANGGYFSIIDVRDPENPSLVGQVYAPNPRIHSFVALPALVRVEVWLRRVAMRMRGTSMSSTCKLLMRRIRTHRKQPVFPRMA